MPVVLAGLWLPLVKTAQCVLENIMSKFFALLLFCIFFSSCFNSTTINASKDLEYYPLPKNAQWEYQAKGGLGSDITNAKVIRNIDGEILISGKTYTKIKTSSPNNSKSEGNSFEFYRIDKDGLYIIENDKPTTKEYLWLPIPIPEQTSWRLTDGNEASEAKAEKITAFEVNGKKYTDCLKITVSKNQNGNPITAFYYLSRGIGLIKLDTKGQFMGTNLSVEMNLENYKSGN